MIHKNITPTRLPKPSDELKKTLISWGFEVKKNNDNNYIDVKMPNGWGINLYQWYPKEEEMIGGVYDSQGYLRLKFIYTHEKYQMEEGKDNNQLNPEYYKIDKGYVVRTKNSILKDVETLKKIYWFHVVNALTQVQADAEYCQLCEYIENIFSFDFTKDELKKLKPEKVAIDKLVVV